MQASSQFDSFRQTLSARTHAEVILYGARKGTEKSAEKSAEKSIVHSLTQSDYLYYEEERGGVDFTLLSAPEDMVLFNYLEDGWGIDRTMLILPLDEGGFYFNGICLDKQQVGVVTPGSRVPFSIRVPAGCHWLVVLFHSKSRHLDLMSSSVIPVSLSTERLDALRQELYRHIAGAQKQGTPVVDQIQLILEEFEQTPPPMRPQKLFGRSRLSRKHLVSEMLKILRSHSSSSPFVEEAASRLGITSHTSIYMFKEVTGLSPKRYWLLRKLYLFRDALLSGEFGLVSDAAFSLDISDLGRMSARYKQLFGEFPSDTLKK